MIFIYGKITSEVIYLILSKINHLTKEEIIKNGSIFTPEHIVKIARSWLINNITKSDIIIDFGVGYGAFIYQFSDLVDRKIATDIDEKSIALINQNFDNIETYVENSLKNISREKYNISDDERLIIIGNPPYNDVTSQYKKGEKGETTMDDIVYSRDLGISFMKMYSLLNPEYICILHPLSYLIKKTNFNSLKFFKDNYLLDRAMIFSSNEFESIKKGNAEFPVCLALYKRNIGNCMDFEYIKNFKFEVLYSDKYFILNNFKLIDGWVEKYPKKDSKKPLDLQFYTIRDINALKRNKTFIIGDVSNGIKVEIPSLYKYAWLDYFKNNFKPNNYYIYGNLSPLYSDRLEDLNVKKELISYIYHSNKIVRDFLENNNLKETVANYYGICEFVDKWSLLEEILLSILNHQTI